MNVPDASNRPARSLQSRGVHWKVDAQGHLHAIDPGTLDDFVMNRFLTADAAQDGTITEGLCVMRRGRFRRWTRTSKRTPSCRLQASTSAPRRRGSRTGGHRRALLGPMLPDVLEGPEKLQLPHALTLSLEGRGHG